MAESQGSITIALHAHLVDASCEPNSAEVGRISLPVTFTTAGDGQFEVSVDTSPITDLFELPDRLREVAQRLRHMDIEVPSDVAIGYRRGATAILEALGDE
ncbi:hypothetical protein ACIGKR_08975 [Rhodococcus qingshengii]|uniref:hypothetical protein n=1 Tax=Rhodococcus qingshengii TaxID=334542 RepID=UPI0037CAE813